MRIAVLGANGFLGKFITSQLTAKGYNVHPVTRKDVDLTNFFSVTRWLEDLEPYAIINCATAPAIGVDVCSYDDIQNNLNIFLNFYNNGHNFTKFINVGSGAEFDRRLDINRATEDSVLLAHPKDSYGYSKNVMSRLSFRHEKFYTLRLFGCFHPTEPEFRLFNRVARGEDVKVVDRQFDYFSARDFLVVLEHYLNNDVYFRDINCVYEEKLYLSQVLNKIKPVEVTGENPLNYTGNGRKLAGLNLPLLGLDESIKEYK
jgi:dTDP-4-dehydrorhamnose reductase